MGEIIGENLPFDGDWYEGRRKMTGDGRGLKYIIT